MKFGTLWVAGGGEGHVLAPRQPRQVCVVTICLANPHCFRKVLLIARHKPDSDGMLCLFFSLVCSGLVLTCAGK